MTAFSMPVWARPREILDLVRLAGPVALSRASFMLMSLTDAVLLARYAPGELPFVLNGWLPIGVITGFGIGLMIGVQVLTANLSGAGQAEETGRIFRRGMVVAVLYGILGTLACLAVARPLLGLLGFDPELAAGTEACTRILAYGFVAHMVGMCASSYLEALRRPNLVTVISMLAVVINLVFDLILVPDYGADGVAWATTGSRIFMAFLLLAAALRFTPALRSSPPAPAGEFQRQTTVGIGTGLSNVAEWGSFNLTFAIATLVSRDAGTVYGLTIQMVGVIFMFYLGLGTATSVRVAESAGRGDRAGVQNASRLGVAASILVGAVLALVLFLLRDLIAVIWLNADQPGAPGAHLVTLLAAMLAAGSLITVFDGLQAVAAMALRAQGAVWIPTSIHVGAYMFLMLPLAWWLTFPQEMGVWGVFLGVSVASVIAGLAQTVAVEIYAARGVLRASPEAAH